MIPFDVQSLLCFFSVSTTFSLSLPTFQSQMIRLRASIRCLYTTFFIPTTIFWENILLTINAVSRMCCTLRESHQKSRLNASNGLYIENVGITRSCISKLQNEICSHSYMVRPVWQSAIQWNEFVKCFRLRPKTNKRKEDNERDALNGSREIYYKNKIFCHAVNAHEFYCPEVFEAKPNTSKNIQQNSGTGSSLEQWQGKLRYGQGN